MSGRRAGPAPARVRELSEQGYGRNACARELGVSRRQVDKLARDAGVDWSRAGTAAATRARMIDRRAELAEDFSDIADRAAERLLQALDADEIDHNVIRALVNAAGTSADKLSTLADRLDADENSPESLLDTMRAGFNNWHAALKAGLDDQGQTTTDDIGDAA
ncbi:hypothetical protein K3888_06995 [Dietzia aurantiaca]|nr:hypothetical protein [Dietzia aurantiaca]